MTSNRALAPLTPAVFHILFALATGDKHGYEIAKQVAEDSQGQVRMGTGTLYGSIKRMLADGLIEQAEDRPAPELDDERRRYYRLTGEGRRALHAEVQRYARVVAVAADRDLLTPA
ncbi:PadR family transcriptional regulator [Dactylosporangium cerinum]|uniref:PadR family transcriptional regulator n=1 Tax=Dactylosporangium cerinum TaxID=1434730 RepID=A0ABV9W7S9_9ACTN